MILGILVEFFGCLYLYSPSFSPHAGRPSRPTTTEIQRKGAVSLDEPLRPNSGNGSPSCVCDIPTDNPSASDADTVSAMQLGALEDMEFTLREVHGLLGDTPVPHVNTDAAPDAASSIVQPEPEPVADSIATPPPCPQEPNAVKSVSLESIAVKPVALNAIAVESIAVKPVVIEPPTEEPKPVQRATLEPAQEVCPEDTHSDPEPVGQPTPEAEPVSATTPEASPKPKEHKETKGMRELVGDVLFYCTLIVLVAVVLMFRGQGEGPTTFAGYSAFTVLSSSMEREIPKGSLIITKHVDPNTLEIGDDITYMRDATSTVTHRIVGIIEDYNETGQRAFRTQGVMNAEPDSTPVVAVNVVGKVIFHSLILGQIVDFIGAYWYLGILFVLLFTGLYAVISRSMFRERKPDHS